MLMILKNLLSGKKMKPIYKIPVFKDFLRLDNLNFQ